MYLKYLIATKTKKKIKSVWKGIIPNQVYFEHSFL